MDISCSGGSNLDAVLYAAQQDGYRVQGMELALISQKGNPLYEGIVLFMEKKVVGNHGPVDLRTSPWEFDRQSDTPPSILGQ